MHIHVGSEYKNPRPVTCPEDVLKAMEDGKRMREQVAMDRASVQTISAGLRVQWRAPVSWHDLVRP